MSSLYSKKESIFPTRLQVIDTYDYGNLEKKCFNYGTNAHVRLFTPAPGGQGHRYQIIFLLFFASFPLHITIIPVNNAELNVNTSCYFSCLYFRVLLNINSVKLISTHLK